MKRINNYKQFESIIDGVSDQEVWEKTYNANILHLTHDFYGFVYKNDKFKELEDGNYKKVLDIEKIHKLTIEHGMVDMSGLNMRATMTGQKLGVIWWPKESTDLIDNKSSNNMEIWLIDTIEKHMSKDHTSGKKVFKKVKDRIQNTHKKAFNL